ncbi:hypothetical protein GIB67_031019 [Kingdonia uniflora]|uniref:Vacuolar membrane protease n=1 Tax=Kingdonia uniflora TaxID=39325 RepID=A0A7J7NGC6_9MAGN|nr:hypothetical protein GIB67_031019 [Kingdonia uniflora]
MSRRSAKSPETSKPIVESDSNEEVGNRGRSPKRSGLLWLALVILMVNGCWGVYHYQFDAMPRPLSFKEAGKRGFSEFEAIKHVEALTELGPHYVGSDALDVALQYVLAASEKIKKMAHWEVDVEVDFFHAEPGANRLVGGLFKGKTLAYSDLKHVVMRISPKYTSGADENAILVSSHIDTVFSTGGAGDCSSCVAVMLELARGVSHWAHGFKNSVIFLFNTGEEEGLNGAHSFITQHPWRSTIRLAVDLEAMGVGGKSSIFQGGPDSWAIENFAKVAKYPSGQIIAQDLFLSGAIKSATDFQVYKEVAGLSGLDFAYVDVGAVYHTKNDKMKLLKPGSLQHLGENMLAFLLQTGASPDLPKGKAVENSEDQAIFFDILGTYMVVYRRRLASMLHNSVILQTLIILATSVFIGGYSAAASLGLSCLSVLLMWIFSLSFSVLVAFVLPLICSSPLPYIASPLLVIGLFVAPSVLGALIGQHVGYLILLKYLRRVSSEKPYDIIKLEAERWLFKAGFVQWLVVLMVGNLFNIGSSYIALVWLVSPAFAYGLIEATLSPVRSPKPLKIVTLLLGLTVPVIISAGMFIRFAGTIAGIVVRFDRNPGGTPEWQGNIMMSVYIAAIVCLTLVYLLSYVHLSGAKKSIMFAVFAIFGITLSAVLTGIVPPFTEDIARVVNVVHVVETTGKYSENQTPSSYISLFSPTPGKLTKEIAHIEEGFVCGKEKVQDFVTFTVNYGCWSTDDTDSGWSKTDIPTLDIEIDTKGDRRMTHVLVDTKGSTRWSLAINTQEIEDFTLEGNTELIPEGDKTGVDGWHIIQFSGGQNAPKKFNMNLFWRQASPESISKADGLENNRNLLLKLRTDVNRLTPKTEKVLEKLPPWCSIFGKSTSPQTLAFLTSLPVDF